MINEYANGESSAPIFYSEFDKHLPSNIIQQYLYTGKQNFFNQVQKIAAVQVNKVLHFLSPQTHPKKKKFLFTVI